MSADSGRGFVMLRDALQRAELARGRQSRLAWMEHAEHAARKLAAVCGPEQRDKLTAAAERLAWLRVYCEDSALRHEVAVVRHGLR